MFKIFGSKKAATKSSVEPKPAIYEVWIIRPGCGQLPYDFIGRYDHRWQAEEAASRVTTHRTSIREYAA